MQSEVPVHHEGQLFLEVIFAELLGSQGLQSGCKVALHMRYFAELLVQTGLLSVEVIQQNLVVFALSHDLAEPVVVVGYFLEIDFFDQSQLNLHLQPLVYVIKEQSFIVPVPMQLLEVGLVLGRQSSTPLAIFIIY